MSDLLPARNFGQTGGERLDFLTGDPNPTHAPFTFETNTSVFGNSTDPVGGWGYNFAYSNNGPVASEPIMRHMIEGNFDRSYAGIPDAVMEQYWEAISADRSIAWRPIMMMADRSAAAGDRQTFMKTLDFAGPAPSSGGTGTTGGIRFFSAKNGPSMQSDEQTYAFGRGAMNIKGFSEYDTSLNIEAGKSKNANIQFGSNGARNVMFIGTGGQNVGRITIGGFDAEMRLRSVNNNKGLSVGVNAQDRSTAALDVGTAGMLNWHVGMRVRGQQGQIGDLVSVEDSTGAVRSGFNKAGAIFTQVNTAPAAADLKAGQAAFSFDATPGASRLVVTAKDTGGALVTGSIPLLSTTGAPATLTAGSGGYDPVDGANVVSLGSGNDVVNGLDVRDLLFGNGGDDSLYGNGGDDLLFGGAGNDQLFGGAGSDVLWGNADNDLLTGGSEADTFAFAPGSGNDRITDFNPGQGDKLALNGQSYMAGDDGQGNLSLTLSGGGTVALQGIAPTTPVATSWFA